MRNRVMLAVGPLVVLVLAARPHAADGPYRLLKEIPIGGEGGWDYLSVDSAARRVYVSHGTRLVVLDLATDTVAGEIADTPGVHGIAIAPDLGRGFTTNGREHMSSIVDLSTLRTIGKVETGQNPDTMNYDPGRHEAYTFNGAGRSATVIDARRGSVVATIPLGGKPEFSAVDPAAGRIYVNIENTNEIAVIDTAMHTVVSRWPIAPGESGAGLAIDTAHHRLFVGAHNSLMLMMDSTTGKVVAQVPIGAGVDANWFDPGTGYAFASCGDGTLTIAHEDSPEKLTVVQTLTTERGARTMALDAATHKLYVAAAKYEPLEPGAPPNARPKLIPGSMRILIYGM